MLRGATKMVFSVFAQMEGTSSRSEVHSRMRMFYRYGYQLGGEELTSHHLLGCETEVARTFGWIDHFELQVDKRFFEFLWMNLYSSN